MQFESAVYHFKLRIYKQIMDNTQTTEALPEMGSPYTYVDADGNKYVGHYGFSSYKVKADKPKPSIEVDSSTVNEITPEAITYKGNTYVLQGDDDTDHG